MDKNKYFILKAAISFLFIACYALATSFSYIALNEYRFRHELRLSVHIKGKLKVQANYPKATKSANRSTHRNFSPAKHSYSCDWRGT